ncbi:MAG: terminase [Nocardioides sp.]|nr:terminase [Nocardioides sp.]
MPWRGPEYDGEVPTLGWDVLDWISEYLIVPDGPAAGQPLELTREQAQFILNFYRVDPTFDGPAITGRSMVNARAVNRAIYCRPKGHGKSPLLGALAIVEAVGDVILDGWDADGEPVGRPWTSLGFKAKVQVLATSEDQTSNTWDPLLEMIRGSETLIDDYGLDPMETFVGGPRLRLEFATSAGDSREGGRPVFAVFDQTESWRSGNGGIRLAAAVRRNLTKTQGSSIESPNAFSPGDKSVAEASFKAHDLQVKQAAKPRSTSKVTILLDHREAPPETDIYDEKSLKKGLAVAYGDSADVNGGWVNLDRVVEDFWDPDSTVEDSRKFFLNQITEREDSWLSQLELNAVKDSSKVVAPGEAITLGFDGSRGRKKGVTDATALIACRVSDGHIFEPFPQSVWEQPTKWPRSQIWSPPRAEIIAAVDQAFRTWRVVGFYADPATWQSDVATWEAKYGPRLLAKATKANPIEWWMTGNRAGRVAPALKAYQDAVLNGEMTYDGGLYLTAHMLQAHTVVRNGAVIIDKEHPDSSKKIDAAIAAVLAWTARLDAISAGAMKKRKKRAPVKRLR